MQEATLGNQQLRAILRMTICILVLRSEATAQTYFDMIAGPNRTVHLRVMTFNTWKAGKNVENGMHKIFGEIRSQTPDIVFIQESRPRLLEFLKKEMGRRWNFCANYGDNSRLNIIMTRFSVLQEFQHLQGNMPISVGCQISIGRYPNQELLNLWNVHFYWGYYGPYAACNKQLKDHYQLYLCEKAGVTSKAPTRLGRLQELLRLMKHPPFWSSLAASVGPFGVPMILAGDFNSPSHLDWIEETRSQHCDWVYRWPMSSLLADYGFSDSYRDVNPNPRTHPGDTWSPIYKYLSDWGGVYIPEPQDRIDRIYYKSYKLRALDSWTTSGNSQINLHPNHRTNQWPSDHSGVVSDFALYLGQR